MQHISKLSNGNAIFSLNPVNFQEIDKIFLSADIGLVGYNKYYGGGRENLHKASGKLSNFLRCGVPVIALDLPGYREMFSNYNCGEVFSHFDQIESLIEKIFNDYPVYQNEAFRCFKEEFEFSQFFNPFINFIKNDLDFTIEEKSSIIKF